MTGCGKEWLKGSPYRTQDQVWGEIRIFERKMLSSGDVHFCGRRREDMEGLASG